MQLIGLGYIHECGGRVQAISKNGVLLTGVPTPATKNDHWLIPLGEAEKRAENGEFHAP